MRILEELKEKAALNPKIIVYPEGIDERVIKAVSVAKFLGIIKEAILLGNKKIIQQKMKKLNISNEGITLIDPIKSDEINRFARMFYDLRKHKNISLKDATRKVKSNLIFAGMLTKTGRADGFVGGALNTTKDMVSAAFYTLGLKKGMSIMSSFFIMELRNPSYGEDGLFLFADCGVIRYPSSRQLANITKATSDSMTNLFGKQARCALLSYSTKGSGQGESVDKVKKALYILRDKYKDIIVDGELQVDTALCDHIAKIKLKKSSVAGRANVLIFPDLDSGNIAYKLVERLAGADATGPILMGLSKPANDLSRGCSVDDIVNVTTVTVLQSD